MIRQRHCLYLELITKIVEHHKKDKAASVRELFILLVKDEMNSAIPTFPHNLSFLCPKTSFVK